METAKKRVAVLISGRGSNMKSLVESAREPDYPAEIVLVLSNKPDAAGLDFAKAENIPAIAIDGKAYDTREAHEVAIHKTLIEHNIDLVCLAGYMRILTEGFVSKWPGKILNIHPSLLPKYPGLNTHQRALDAGDEKHGCTVHIVTGELDAGPIVAQAEMPVLAGDDVESLTARVLMQEHSLYPKALGILTDK